MGISADADLDQGLEREEGEAKKVGKANLNDKAVAVDVDMEKQLIKSTLESLIVLFDPLLDVEKKFKLILDGVSKKKSNKN